MEKRELPTNPCSVPSLRHLSLSLPNWKDFPSEELGFLPDQPPSCFFNLGTEGFMDRISPFDSGVSSIKSFTKLNLSAIENQFGGNLPISADLVSPHPGFAPISPDPGFAERAAKLSCLGSWNPEHIPGRLGLAEPLLSGRSAPGPEGRTISRVASSQSLKSGSQMGSLEKKEMQLQEGIAAERKFGRSSRPSTPDNVEFSCARGESSNSSSKCANEINGRKRKAAPTATSKDLLPSLASANDVTEDGSNSKRCKTAEHVDDGNDGLKPKEEEESGMEGGENCKTQRKENSKPPEPQKQDYIHVRARRGQATDSHSLAERVRREKISERMKFLQDLVPGCNKLTGKAVMLDEIINYVQSLQRQVEFLSMKLATINPRLDMNEETLLPKDLQILQSRGPFYSFESSAAAYHKPHGHDQGGQAPSTVSNGSDTRCSVNSLDAALDRSLGLQMPANDGFADASSQLTRQWHDELQSVVQMGFGRNQEIAFPFQSFHGR